MGCPSVAAGEVRGTWQNIFFGSIIVISDGGNVAPSQWLFDKFEDLGGLVLNATHISEGGGAGDIY